MFKQKHEEYMTCKNSKLCYLNYFDIFYNNTTEIFIHRTFDFDTNWWVSNVSFLLYDEQICDLNRFIVQAIIKMGGRFLISQEARQNTSRSAPSF